MQNLFLMYAAFSLLGMFLSIPMMMNKIKPNPYYRFRVRETMEDSKLWYAVNRYFSLRLFIVSLIELIAAVVLYFFAHLNLDAYSLSLLGIYVLTFGIAFQQTLRHMKSLKQKSSPNHE